MSPRALIPLCAALLLSGCALEPQAASVEVQHDSHILQHLQAHPTNYGYQAVGVAIHWQFTRRWYADAFEGVDFAGCSRGDGFEAGRETFSARAGYTFWSRQ